MKILHICRQYWPSVGGVERFVHDLAIRTAGRGYTVEIATLNRAWNNPSVLPAHDDVDGIAVHRLPFVGGALFFLAPAIYPLVSGFDILHIHNTDFFLDFLTMTRYWHRKPIVVSTHGGFFHTTSFSWIKQIYFAAITRSSLLAASAVIPNSAADEQHFGSFARRCVRIDNAIDYTKFSSVQRERMPGKLVTVGRLSANKNINILLEVFAIARRSRPDLTLAIVGDGHLATSLKELAKAHKIEDAVIWLGEINDDVLLETLASAKLFISASRYEGFGLALLESMAAGVIPVVNDIDAFRTIVLQGQNGYLADYGNVNETAQQWLQALELPDIKQVQMREQAQQTAQSYDWSTTLDKFEAVYIASIEESKA